MGCGLVFKQTMHEMKDTLQLPRVGAKLQSMKLMSVISVSHNLMSVGVGLKSSQAPSSSW